MAVVLSRPKRHKPQWHRLQVAAVQRLTDEAVTVAFDVPPKLRETFDFSPGQHLTLRRFVDDEEIRRSYSICSPLSTLRQHGLLRVGIKKIPSGAFSGYAVSGVHAGDWVEVLPPLGAFGGERAAQWQRADAAEAEVNAARHYAAIVAGSGITPVLSIVATALEAEPDSRVTVLYGNKASATVMFADELADLKDRFRQRVQLIHVLSREEQSAELLHGRLDPARLHRIFAQLLPPDDVDEWFLCGPYGMVIGAQQALSEAAVDAERVHTELFYAEELPPPQSQEPKTAAAELTVWLDGRASRVDMGADQRVLDAALTARAELPYACKGGVCATCRAKLVQGEVHMARNFALDQSDLDAGYVLTCQSTALTDKLEVDYDA